MNGEIPIEQLQRSTADDAPRVITLREVFESCYLPIYKTCLGLAINELSEVELSHPDLKYTMADALSCAATLFISWTREEARIEFLRKQKQEAWDKKFPEKLIKKGV